MELSRAIRVAALTLPSALGAAGPAAGQGAARIGAYLEPIARAGDLSGTVLVGRASRVIYEHSFGRETYPGGRPNRPATPFNVASVTKPLTLIMTLELADRGRLSTSDSLAKWIPGFPAGGRITVAQLLAHTSGIPHRVTTAADESAPQTAEAMARLAAERPLLFEPGTSTTYSSAGYSVLARVLELAGGASYDALLRQLVFEPAHVRGAWDATAARPLPDRAASYARAADGPMPADTPDLSFLVGAGSIYATPRQLFGVVRALVRGSYGIAARTALIDSTGRFYWNGVTNGYRAFVAYDSAGDVTVIATLNLLTGAADFLRRDLPRLARGEQLPPAAIPAFRAVALRPAEWCALAGSYARAGGAAVPLERLSPTLLRRGTYLIIPVGGDRFFSTQDYAEIRAVRADDGSVAALVWGRGGPRFERAAGSCPGGYR